MKMLTAKALAKVIIDTIICHYGLLNSIVINYGYHFKSQFGLCCVILQISDVKSTQVITLKMTMKKSVKVAQTRLISNLVSHLRKMIRFSTYYDKVCLQ